MKRNRFFNFKTLDKLLQLSNFSWNDVEINLLSIRAGRHGGEIKNIFPISINNHLGCIVGHILGDGSIDKKYSQVFFTNKNYDLIVEFYSSMKEIFDIEPRIWLQRNGNFKTKSKWIRKLDSIQDIPSNSQIGLFYPSICGLILNSIFISFAVGKNKVITENIMNTSKQFKISFVRAFFDDEGHLDRERGPRFHQDRKDILERIKEILFELGINSFPVRYSLIREKPRFFFNINRRENYKKYFDVVGCTSKNKLESLKQLVMKNEENQRTAFRRAK